jgi:hypothetical protein
MAFGKKKDEPVAATAEALAEAPLDLAEAPVEEPTSMEPAPEAAQSEAPVAPAPAADPLAGGGDALLNMFQATQIQLEDRSAVLELAGEVEIDDLVEELHTVAVALGITVEV